QRQSSHCYLTLLIVNTRPSRDRHRFQVNGWLTLKSGHSAIAIDQPTHIQTRRSDGAIITLNTERTQS
ncbi:MAG: hypothetical protein WCH01_09075, partial [Methylococcaceae bacterium]